MVNIHHGEFMGLLDMIGLGAIKGALVVGSWIALILVTIFVPFAFIVTIPLMIFLPVVTALLLVRPHKRVPDGCAMVDGKMECSVKGI
jgi:hypothetical protein